MRDKSKIKELFSSGEQIFAPCVYDCMGAVAAVKSGYKALMFSGGAIAYSMDGQPDMAFGTLDEVITVTERISSCIDVPCIIDFDDGYAESPAVIYRNVKRLIQAGAKGFTLDDTTGIRGYERSEYYHANPDKINPGHKVIDRDKWLAKIKAAVMACEGEDCVVIARTECAQQCGFDEAITRCVMARELGAPMTTICGGMSDLDKGKLAASRDVGWKMWPDVITVNGKPNVELEDVKNLGFNFVTMHVFEKAALYGMIRYGFHNLKAGNTVYSTQHAIGGLTNQEQQELLCMRRTSAE